LRELFKGRGARAGPRESLPEILSAASVPTGPGLAIRCRRRDHAGELEILRNADAVYIDQIRKAGPLRQDLAGRFCGAAGPSKTVGVMGDGRLTNMSWGLREVNLDRRHDRGFFIRST